LAIDSAYRHLAQLAVLKAMVDKADQPINDKKTVRKKGDAMLRTKRGSSGIVGHHQMAVQYRKDKASMEELSEKKRNGRRKWLSVVLEDFNGRRARQGHDNACWDVESIKKEDLKMILKIFRGPRCGTSKMDSDGN